MPTDTVQILSASTEPDRLYATAVSLAKSAEPADHRTLGEFLSKESFLGRLDSAADYERGARYLRIARLVKLLREPHTAGGHQVLVDLTQQKEFISNETRVELLIWASAVIRPAPPALVKFWDDHCQPSDGFNGLSAVAMADNGSEPAIALLEKKLAASGFDDEERIWWMRTAILTHREDVPVLKACQRLLERGLPETLRPELVAVLFTYRPDEWHGPDAAYPPPPAGRGGEEAHRTLQAIGEHALTNLKLDPALREIVKAKVQ